MTVKMRYPGIDFFSEGINLGNISNSIKTVAKCVAQIVAGEEVYNSADMSEEEVVE